MRRVVWRVAGFACCSCRHGCAKCIPLGMMQALALVPFRFGRVFAVSTAVAVRDRQAAVSLGWVDPSLYCCVLECAR
jgi:hypothetical protein